MRRPIALLLATSLVGAGCTAARHPVDAGPTTQAKTEATGPGTAPVAGDGTSGRKPPPPIATVLVGAAIAIGIVALALSKHDSDSSMDFVPPTPL